MDRVMNRKMALTDNTDSTDKSLFILRKGL